MSTKIFDAWHLGKPESIYNLTILARRVHDIQQETRAAEIAQSVTLVMEPWLRSALEFFGDDAADEFAVLVGGAIYPILRRNAWLTTWAFPDKEREFLKDFLTRHLKEKYVPNREECMDALQFVCEEIYEFSARSTPRLYFLSDSAGKDIYVKGLGLTKEAIRYLDTFYERFEYTDSCEMDESDFPALKEQFASSSDKDALLSKAQKERGALWDDAMYGCTRFDEAGLSFDLDDKLCKAERVAELRKVAKIIFEKGKGGDNKNENFGSF